MSIAFIVIGSIIGFILAMLLGGNRILTDYRTGIKIGGQAVTREDFSPYGTFVLLLGVVLGGLSGWGIGTMVENRRGLDEKESKESKEREKLNERERLKPIMEKLERNDNRGKALLARARSVAEESGWTVNVAGTYAITLGDGDGGKTYANRWNQASEIPDALVLKFMAYSPTAFSGDTLFLTIVYTTSTGVCIVDAELGTSKIIKNVRFTDLEPGKIKSVVQEWINCFK